MQNPQPDLLKLKKNFKTWSWVQKSELSLLKLWTLYIFNLYPSLETPEFIIIT